MTSASDDLTHEKDGGRLLYKGRSCVTVHSDGSFGAFSYVRKECFDAKDYCNEVAALSRLPIHPNLVEIVGFEPSVRTVILRDGGQDLIDARPRLASYRAACVQMSAALAHVHSHGVVHRDVKCENFLVDACDRVRLCDFGFAARTKDDAALCTGRLGSLPYAAPEIMSWKEGDGPYDARAADVWALGVSMYGVMFGTLLWTMASNKDTTYAEICTKSKSVGRGLCTTACVLMKGMTVDQCKPYKWLDAFLHVEPSARNTLIY
jgi:serine/threonine protein kinase